MAIQPAKHPASYRDPAGFIFSQDGTIYRQVNQVFQTDFDLFINSGCYQALVDKGLILAHREVDLQLPTDSNRYKTLKPELVGFISYPSEWPFDMLKDAALLTLRLMKEAIAFGLILKDATPYNIQWHEGALRFIDSLSFERYDPSQPWDAYRQFCESFLGPLLLNHYGKLPSAKAFLAYPDGVPVSVTAGILPWRSRFSFHTYLHIHLQNKLTKNATVGTGQAGNFSKQKLLNLVSSLESLVSSLRLPKQATTWSGYYDEASTRNDYLARKLAMVREWIGLLSGNLSCIDFGANEGEFSCIASEANLETVAVDFDPLCVNRLYQASKAGFRKKILPLVIDLSNPTPGTGLDNREHQSFSNRGKFDIALALALIHHLAIGKNIPLERSAAFFARFTKYLVIEFVPKSDEKIRLMLSGRKDIYTTYSQENFESAFAEHFETLRSADIAGSGRILYLMARKEADIPAANI